MNNMPKVSDYIFGICLMFVPVALLLLNNYHHNKSMKSYKREKIKLINKCNDFQTKHGINMDYNRNMLP